MARITNTNDLDGVKTFYTGKSIQDAFKEGLYPNGYKPGSYAIEYQRQHIGIGSLRVLLQITQAGESGLTSGSFQSGDVALAESLRADHGLVTKESGDEGVIYVANQPAMSRAILGKYFPVGRRDVT